MSVEKILIAIIVGILMGLAITVSVFKQLPYRNKLDKLKFLIIICLYIGIALLFIPNQFRFLLFIIVISLILYFVLNINDKKLVLYAFNTVVILSICEIISTLLLIMLGVNSESIVDNIMYNLLVNVIISVLCIVIVNLPFTNKLITKFMNLFNKNKNLINYLYVFLIVIYLIVSKNGLELVSKYNYFLNALFMIGITGIVVIVIKNEFKSEQLKEMNKEMLNYVTKYEKIITEQGKANHEFKNQLMVIKGYAQMTSSQASNNKLLEYLELIINESKKTSNSYFISQLNKFPMGGIKGLLYYKLSLMEDEKIKCEIDVETGVKTKLNSLNVNMYKNITKILGVLLDNAIDASKKCKNKKILLSVTKEKNKVIFSISNTYKGKIKIDRIGTGYTTKGNGHGFGLRLVNDIVNSDNDLEIENDVNDEYYITKIIIKTNQAKKKK